ncbi:protein containing a thioredoxin domain [Planctomycetales bacterium 10988]|nr:protein containing a thioredoxin domain [Planctomycetales bacterium 10988]
MSNRLANESSPYLLQHAENPVDWYPWGEEALQRSKAEEKPIFLSVGYAACHWCHVMEHESFESDEIAQFMNEHFVNVKVDREERPDLDQIYMTAVQMMTGQGGWPLNVFLTPELKPIYGGTYWPPERRFQMPSFLEVLDAVRDAWTERREQANQEANFRLEQMQKRRNWSRPGTNLDRNLLEQVARTLSEIFDETHGGFGSAPKFPHAIDLRVLMRVGQILNSDRCRRMVQLTLDKMAQGGLYDHLGGGFHRYSVDPIWLVPHFEKMLYDNAMLAMTYLEGYQKFGEKRYAQVAEEILDYILAEMTDEQGGFYSTQDADSEGVEGKFYIWNPEEIREVLGQEEAELFLKVYKVSDEGNFEGKTILNLDQSLEEWAKEFNQEPDSFLNSLKSSRDKLYQARQKRIAPGLDDKIIVSWNALMLEAMAFGSLVLNREDFLQAAIKAGEFLQESLRDQEGKLYHWWRNGKAKGTGFLDDYSYLINSLLTLYEASGQERWIDWAMELVEILLDQFHDEEEGGFFYTPRSGEQLILRNKDAEDGSVPSGNAMAAFALLRVYQLTGKDSFYKIAVETLKQHAGMMREYPSAAGQSLLGVYFLCEPSIEFVLVSANEDDSYSKLKKKLFEGFRPNRVVATRTTELNAYHSSHLDELFQGKTAEQGIAFYRCEQFQCQEPTIGEEAILEEIEKL